MDGPGAPASVEDMEDAFDEQGRRVSPVLPSTTKNYHWIDNHIARATRSNTRFTDLIRRTVEIEVFKDD